METKNMNESIDEIFGYLIRESFSDRIYDDLCEDILQWLSIEDKIKLTAVSKQFERCLHSLWLRQRVLTIDCLDLNYVTNRYDSKTAFLPSGWVSQEIVENGIEKILQQFPNVNEIHYERIPSYNDLILRAIIRRCTHLQRFRFSFVNCSSQAIEEFGLKFGPNLKGLEVADRNHMIKPLMSYSPNLLSIKNIYFMDLFENNEVLVKKVKKLKTYGISDKQLLETFIDNNKGLTHLDINFSFEDSLVRTDAIAKLAELKELKVLKILFSDCDVYDKQIVKSIKMIANECKNLKAFVLEVESRKSFDTKNFFDSFEHFSTLKRLCLNSHDSSTPNPIPIQRLDSSCLENCKHLTHLELMSDQIDDQFFVDIESVFKELKQLIIGMIGENVTDITMESLTRLRHLESLHIKRLDNLWLKSITESGFQKLFNGCHGLHTFGVFSRMPYTYTTVETLIHKAVENPLIYYKYYLRGIEDFVNVEEVIKRYDFNINNIIITGSKRVFDRVRSFN